MTDGVDPVQPASSTANAARPAASRLINRVYGEAVLPDVGELSAVGVPLRAADGVAAVDAVVDVALCEALAVLPGDADSGVVVAVGVSVGVGVGLVVDAPGVVGAGVVGVGDGDAVVGVGVGVGVDFGVFVDVSVVPDGMLGTVVGTCGDGSPDGM